MDFVNAFRTDEQIEREISLFEEKEEQSYQEYLKSDRDCFNRKYLKKFRTVYDAKPYWKELGNKQGTDKQDLIDLLCQPSPIYDCCKGHSRRNYDLARIIRYSMSPGQRKVCYSILSK